MDVPSGIVQVPQLLVYLLTDLAGQPLEEGGRGLEVRRGCEAVSQMRHAPWGPVQLVSLLKMHSWAGREAGDVMSYKDGQKSVRPGFVYSQAVKDLQKKKRLRMTLEKMISWLQMRGGPLVMNHF